METTRAIDCFFALAQSARLDAVRALVRAGDEGMAAGQLAAHLDIRPNLLSSHLGILKAAGLVSAQRQGRIIRYRIRFDTLRALTGFLLEDCCGGLRGSVEPALAQLFEGATT